MIALEKVSKVFNVRNPYSFKVTVVEALKEVSVEIKEGLTTSIVGESGSGKTTLANIMMGKIEPDSGLVKFLGKVLDEKVRRELSRSIHVVFQNPSSSLNPRMQVFDIISEPLLFRTNLSKPEIYQRILKVTEDVKLDRDILEKFPHELSGGEKQRVSIARAIVSNPKIIILDEPVASLDVSIRSQILNLLVDLKTKYNFTYVFISHDMATTRFISDIIVVLYKGRILEEGTVEEIFQNPLNPYTKYLLFSVPSQRIIPHFEVLYRDGISQGCPFYNKCPLALDICKQKFPEAKMFSKTHKVMCHAV